MQLRATVLGRIEFHVDGCTVGIGGPRQRRLLGALLVHRGEVVSTSCLIDAVWEGAPPSAAERTFRSYIARLRRSFDDVGVDGAAVVNTAHSGYSICAEVDVDAARFEVELAHARRRLELGDAAASRRHLDEALDCWSGVAFGEFAHEEWAVAEAVRLEELRLVARELSVEADLEMGVPDAAIADARRLVETHPLRERPRRLLMLAFYRSGRQADAVRVARDYGDLLRDQTGLAPSRELDELEYRILHSDPRLDGPAIAARSIRGYQLGGVLVSSSRAVTYRAQRASSQEELALTAISRHVADDASFIRDFELQARTRAAIRHPGLVPWLDYWREPGIAYVVSHLPSGCTLRGRWHSDEPWTIEFCRPLAGVSWLADLVRVLFLVRGCFWAGRV